MQLNKILLSMVSVLFMTSMAMAASYEDDDPGPVFPDRVSPPPLGGQAPGVGVTGSGAPRGPSPRPHAAGVGASAVWHAKSNGGMWNVFLASESREDHIGIMKAPTDKINSAAKLKAEIFAWLRAKRMPEARSYLVLSEASRKVLMTDETLLETIPICTAYNKGTLIVYLG